MANHIIVGGTSGVGFATARLLVARGDTVAVLGRSAERARSAAQRLSPDRAFGDGLDDGGLEATIQRSIARMGGVDGLAVTAGPINAFGEILHLSDDDWLEAFDTHVMTAVRAIRAVVPPMKAQARGAIVTTAAYSMRAQKPTLPHYTAMKAAIASITKNAAKTYGAFGIRANCVAPGAIASEALDSTRRQIATARGVEAASDADLWQAMREKYGQTAALDRIGRPEEVGELIAFLLSGEGAYMTGALINIDGGTDF